MTTLRTTPFDRDIHYTHRPADFCYDVFIGNEWVASARTNGAGDEASDDVGYARLLAQPPEQSSRAVHLMPLLDAGSADEEIAADTLVIRADAPAQLAAAVQADALLLEADAVMAKAVCPTCEGEGRIPCGDGCGDQAGGWAETCPDCDGKTPARAYLCFVDDCSAQPMHMHGDNPLCCTHYAEYSGLKCLCEYSQCDAHGCHNPVTHTLQMGALAEYHVCCTHYPDIAGEPCGCEAELAAIQVEPAPICAGFQPGRCNRPANPTTAPFCRTCAGALDKMVAAAMVHHWRVQAGLLCSFCGEPHESDACPLKKPLVVPAPTMCKNCGGSHSIQRCPTIWTLLRRFA